MSEHQPQASDPIDSAFEIAIAIRAIPPPTTHAPATSCGMYTCRHRGVG